MLEVVKPLQIEIAIEASKQLSKTREESKRQRNLRLQRAEYEAELAERNYRAVDATNRLVATTLERQWEQALEKLANLRQEQRREADKEEGQQINSRQQGELRKLSEELPRVWAATTTENRDRKRIVRLLIKDITLERQPESRQINLHIRWQGGGQETIVHQPPARTCDKWRYGEEIVARVRALSETYHCDAEIAKKLNLEGFKASKAEHFTDKAIRWIRYKHRIKCDPKRAGELGVTEAMERFGVSRHMIYYWIERGYITSRQDEASKRYYVAIDPGKEKELRERIEHSYKL